jgi:NTE family protein
MQTISSDASARGDRGITSKFNAEWDFPRLLRDEGRRCAESFLASHGASVGKNSTLDLDVLLEQV